MSQTIVTIAAPLNTQLAFINLPSISRYLACRVRTSYTSWNYFPDSLLEIAIGAILPRVGISGTGLISESATPFLSNSAMRLPYQSDKGAAVMPWANTLMNMVIMTAA